MKIFEINSGNYGSTGNIMLNISETAKKAGHDVMVAFRKSRSVTSSGKENEVLIGNSFYGLIHRVVGEFLGLEGFSSIIPTLNLIKKIKKFEPDIIHLHLIHGWYINFPILFRFLKEYNKPVVWTMHDCWAFTGHCPYFDMAKCEKWKTSCFNCPNYRNYPDSRIDTSKFMHKMKKKCFSELGNLTIVTPSFWLADLVKQSFLQKYPVKVINNGINLEIFTPQNSKFREDNNISAEKNIILGVSFDWDERKGIDVFKKLSLDLGDNYKIVLVGINENLEKELPAGILGIKRTQSAEILAEIYSSADVFLNPTREENFPTVNMEALACGIPVLTFRTGGSPEIINEKCGSVVDCDDYESLKNEIIRICETKPFLSSDCIERAKIFDMNDKFKEYVKLYESI